MRAHLVLVATCTVFACSGGDQRDASPNDAGVDGGRDAGFDAANEVGSDARLDGGPDANVDAGPDPHWQRLPGFPDECYVERALHPENALSFHWENCTDELPACQMVTIDSSTAPFDHILAWNGGNDLRGSVAWHLIEATGTHDVIVITHDEVAIAAWRSNYRVAGASCGPWVALGAATMGVDQQFVRGGESSHFVSVASLSDLTTLDSMVWTSTSELVPPGDFLQTPSASGTTFAGMLLSGNILAVEPPNAEVLGQGDLGPVVVGHSVLWNWGDASGASGIHISRIGGTEVELYRAAAGTSVLGVRADGTWITWRSYTASSPGDTLWAAPYRETAPLDARPLWNDLSPGTSGTIGDGMLAHADQPEPGADLVIHVIDLADGSRREVALPDPLPSGATWHISGEAAWVTRDEVAFPAFRIDGSHTTSTLVRIDLMALPAQALPGPDAGVDGGM